MMDTDLDIQSHPQSRAPKSMSSCRFWSSYTRLLHESRPHLTLDGTEYPVIGQEQVPSRYAEVDVKVDNNGVEIPCVIVAGFVGMGLSPVAISPFPGPGRTIHSGLFLRGGSIPSWRNLRRQVCGSCSATSLRCHIGVQRCHLSSSAVELSSRTHTEHLGSSPREPLCPLSFQPSQRLCSQYPSTHLPRRSSFRHPMR
jgi:hypothetical protein